MLEKQSSEFLFYEDLTEYIFVALISQQVLKLISLV